MRDILVTLIVMGSIPIILIKPHIGVLMWSWISYMNPHRLTWGFAYDFRFALIVGAVTIFAWLISREPKRLPWHPVTFLLVALTLWVSFTTLFAEFPDHAQAKWERTIKILVVNGFLTLALMRSKPRLDALIWVIVVSIGFFGVKGGIFTLLTGGTYILSGPGDTFIGDNNSLALALITVMPLMRYLQLSTEMRWIRWGLVVAMLLCLIAVLGTHSRGGLIGLAAMLLVLFVKTRRKLLISVGLGLVLAFGIGFMPERWQGRMESILAYEQEASAQTRFEAWQYAIDTAMESPLIGGGFEVFRGNKAPTLAGYRSAHSIYFEVLGEHGFVGLVLFLALGIATFLAGRSIIRQARGNPDLAWARDLASMIQAGLVGYAVAGVFLNLAFFDLYYHLVAIMALTSVLASETLSESGEQPLDTAASVQAKGAARFFP